MVNRSKGKGTSAESALALYLREHGWPYAERRSLAGALDKGDITGCIGLAFEVKYTSERMQLGGWLTETSVERRNAGADHGILVIKPPGLGAQRVGRWYAAMLGEDFERLRESAILHDILRVTEECLKPVSIVDREPVTYSVSTMRHEMTDAVKMLTDPNVQVPVLTLRPKGTKDRPEGWYRVTTVDGIVRILRMAGYGDPEHS